MAEDRKNEKGRPDPERQERDEDREHMRAIQKERQGRVVKALVTIALVVLFIVFILQNTEGVPVEFLFFEFEPPLIWVFVVVALLGGIVGYVLGRPSRRLRLHRREERKKKGS